MDLNQLKAEVERLESELTSTKRDKDWLYEQWQGAQATLEEIQNDDIGLVATKMRAERDALAAEVQELDGTKDWLWEKWKDCEQQLDVVHSSTMWKVWMAWHMARRILLAPFVLVFSIPLVIARGVWALCKLAALGWIWLTTSALMWRAGRRRSKNTDADALPSLTASQGRVPARRPRVLIAMPYHIHPPNHGGGVRLFNLVQRLSQTCDLYLLIFSPIGEDEEQRKALEPFAKRVDFHHWIPQHTKDRLDISPPNAQLFWSERVAELFNDIVLGHQIDIVQLEYTELGQYADLIPDGVPVILTEHDIAFRTQERRRQLRFMDRYPDSKAYCDSASDLRRLVQHEVHMCREVHRLHVMSEEDGDYLASFMPDGWSRIRVAPNGVDCEKLAVEDPTAVRKGVLYVGNFQNLPNMDAIEYLINDVWPLLRLRVPDATLTVVGAHAEGKITHFHGRDGINVVGQVPEIRSYYHDHRVLAAPIRAGSGTRLKILEAFAAGLPVVSTTLGAEGIAYQEGRHLVTADTAVAFAEALENMLSDDEMARNIAGQGRILAEQRYDWGKVAEIMVDDYAGLLEDYNLVERCESPVGGDPKQRHSDNQQGPGERLPVISVVMPTLNGGERMFEAIDAIFAQDIDEPFELCCVDSGSDEAEVQAMLDRGARVWSISKKDFNHGLTRDLLARLSRGSLLVYLNQDAVPADSKWLERITAPLLHGTSDVVAVQGGIREVDDFAQRFYWDSCGERFYFTSESESWISNYRGIGFSTVNSAVRREVMMRYPFGHTPIMEDKKWQRRINAAGLGISDAPEAVAVHTHDYDFPGLVKRCRDEGFGWRVLGEGYGLLTMLRDMFKLKVWKQLVTGSDGGRRRRTSAAILFPVVRPLALYWGNNFRRSM